MRTSIALEFCSDSSVVDNMDRFLMNLSIVICGPGDILFSSLRTPINRLATHQRARTDDFSLLCSTVLSATVSFTWFSACEKMKKMLAIRLSQSSASSPSSSSTLLRTSDRGSKTEFLDNILQKSFFGVEPCNSIRFTASCQFKGTKHLPVAQKRSKYR